MVSVVAEKEFRIPNTKYTFPINAGRTGRRLSGSSGSFCCLSVLNDNGGLFRQTGAQRPRAGVSVGHTDVRHSLISAVGAHPSASDGVCGGSLCASLAAGRIGSSHPLLALILFPRLHAFCVLPPKVSCRRKCPAAAGDVEPPQALSSGRGTRAGMHKEASSLKGTGFFGCRDSRSSRE